MSHFRDIIDTLYIDAGIADMVFLQNILFFLNSKIMKHLIPFLLVLFISNALFAQDIIVTKNSEKIEAKITDVEHFYIS